MAQVQVDKKYFPDLKKAPQLLTDLVKNVNGKIDEVVDDEIIKLSTDIHYNGYDGDCGLRSYSPKKTPLRGRMIDLII